MIERWEITLLANDDTEVGRLLMTDEPAQADILEAMETFDGVKAVVNKAYEKLPFA